jgi:poly-gamma-glutamate synthesis protein (capsule biosynthesis protein)
MPIGVRIRLIMGHGATAGYPSPTTRPHRERTGRDRHITLFVCGDVMIGRGVDQILPRSCPPRLHEVFVKSALSYVDLAERANGPIVRPVGHDYIWGEARAVLALVQPDATIINLETSVTISEDAELKAINYRVHPGNVPVLTAAGIDCCVLANNHVLDWGRAGLHETLDTLAGAGIRVAGAGRNLGAASAPALLDIEGGRVLVFAFGVTDSGIPRTWAAGAATPGVHLLPDFSKTTVERIAELVRSSKQPGDLAVASVHWGPNWGFHVGEDHRRFAHALIDRARIDVVHGHSSHHPKAIEVYRGRPILYGCGELLNDYEGIRGYEEFRSDLVLMYFLTLDSGSGRLIQLTMTPMQIRNFRLLRPSPLDRTWLYQRIDRECRRFGGRISLRDDDFALQWPAANGDVSALGGGGLLE